MSINKKLFEAAGMNHDMCVGGALMMSFVIDLFTMSGKQAFTPAEIVNILDIIAHRELPDGMIDHVKTVADQINGGSEGR